MGGPRRGKGNSEAKASHAQDDVRVHRTDGATLQRSGKDSGKGQRRTKGSSKGKGGGLKGPKGKKGPSTAIDSDDSDESDEEDEDEDSSQESGDDKQVSSGKGGGKSKGKGNTKGKGETAQRDKATGDAWKDQHRKEQRQLRGDDDDGVQRVVDPAKARSVLVEWLVRTHSMDWMLAESQEGISESMTWHRGHGTTLFTCNLVIPSLQLGPVASPEPLANRKTAVAAAYAAAVAELKVPVPPRAAMSQHALLKKSKEEAVREERAELQKNKQRDQQERKSQQRMASKLEAQQRADQMAHKVFVEQLGPQVTAALPGGEPQFTLPMPQKVTKPITEKTEQRAVSDLTNLCNRETWLLDGPPVFFEKSLAFPHQGNAYCVIAMVKVVKADRHSLASIVGCAYGAKRASAKAAAARQCLQRIHTRVPLPVMTEMAQEIAGMRKDAADATVSDESWAPLATAVSEMRKLEAKGIGGLRLAILETTEEFVPGSALSGPFCAWLTGRIPQENGYLRDFHGVCASGRCSQRLAAATACQDAFSRLSAHFGGGDVTDWLRRMAVTPMELEELPWEVANGLRGLELDSWRRERELKFRLEAWSRQRTLRHTAFAPDLSQGAAPVVPELYNPPAGDGKEDPGEMAKRARGVSRPASSLLHA